MIESLYWIKL